LKLAVVFNPLDNKMREDTYSYIYRGMFDAIQERFNPIHVTEDCNAEEIEADAILFWDVNSCHHIKIEGVEKHPALKLEYMSDPFQREVHGIYQRYNMPVHKLGAEQRLRRALERGVCRIICPTEAGYYRYFAPILGEEADKMLLFFPHAPWFSAGKERLNGREKKVLANGATGDAQGAYDFRTWAYRHPDVSVIAHWIQNRSTPMGKHYGGFLKEWAGALALCDLYPVVKYYEMPLAGCVTFMQHHPELEKLGFHDYNNCVFVNRENFDGRIKEFLNDPLSYQLVADRGRKLMEENYTAHHFAEYLANKIKEATGK
jgi:hypothetical protein